ncbi:hypothetical protein ACTWJ8_38405 [Streptomyces sp. SDT5-1]|uniref:hypothetical protein n=1 Tax=Streptomyces sp. SDT5-1 TaxID=3406418 RepID=UPI003FD33433
MGRTASWPTAAVAAATLALAGLTTPAAWAADDDPAWDTGMDTGSEWTESPPMADTSGTLELVPRDPGPGASVTASTSACGDDRAASGDAASVGAGEFPLETATQEGSVTGQFKIPGGSRSGTFPITVTCESGAVVRRTVTVSAGRGGTELGGVKAGDGGSLGTLSVTQLALGGVLIAGALVAAGHYARRRAQET